MSETPVKERQTASPSRRAFLLGAPTIAAAATAGAAQGAETPTGPKDRNDPVYRDTEHIRRFYQRSRF